MHIGRWQLVLDITTGPEIDLQGDLFAQDQTIKAKQTSEDKFGVLLYCAL